MAVLRTLLIAALLLLPAAATAGERVVAIGDIHGAYDALVDILMRTGLIDERRDWVGEGVSFVQTGDFTDRGSRVRDVMELLMELEVQAEAAGDEVRLLLGNHEVMNLIGDDRSVMENPDIYASFTDDASDNRRDKAYDAWRAWRDRRRDALEVLAEQHDIVLTADLVRFLDQSRDEWMEAHPRGLVEYREAFSPEGRFGSWLRRLPMVARVGDSLFLHAGLSADYAEMSIDQLNKLHWRKIKEWDKNRARLSKRGLILPWFSWVETRMALELELRAPQTVFTRNLARSVWDSLDGLLETVGSDNSPLWFRGYSPPPRGLDDDELATLLDLTDRTHKVRRTVAGHTPLGEHEILERLGGRVFLIDTGMLTRYYGGRASALEISGTQVSTVYAERPPEVRVEIVHAARHSARLRPMAAAASSRREYSFLGADGQVLPIQELDELEHFLNTARVLSRVPLGSGTSGAERLILESDGVRAHAVFHTVDEDRGGPTDPVTLGDGTRVMYFRDSYRSQAGVYRLSRIMGMNNVPPSVVRTIDGDEGSVTLWIEDGTDLTRWRERGEGDPRTTFFNRQISDMRVFDNLIHNTDRNTGNIFWTGDFSIWLIDHTRSLSRDEQLYRADKLTRCSREMLERLEELDAKEVEAALLPYASKFDVKALMKRRDKILGVIHKNIKKMGEEKVLFSYGDPVRTKISSEAS
jgi:hypothetical protein